MLNRKLRNLAEEFRRGIASALGVPPGAIREDVVEKWVREWAKAFIKPEFWRRYVEASSPTRVEMATTELFTHIKEVTRKNAENAESTIKSSTKKGI